MHLRHGLAAQLKCAHHAFDGVAEHRGKRGIAYLKRKQPQQEIRMTHHRIILCPAYISRTSSNQSKWHSQVPKTCLCRTRTLATGRPSNHGVMTSFNTAVLAGVWPVSGVGFRSEKSDDPDNKTLYLCKYLWILEYPQPSLAHVPRSSWKAALMASRAVASRAAAQRTVSNAREACVVSSVNTVCIVPDIHRCQAYN